MQCDRILWTPTITVVSFYVPQQCYYLLLIILISRNNLTAIMARRVQEIDVKLLLFAIQRTTYFEELLSRKFSGVTLDRGNGTSSSKNQVGISYAS